MISIELFDIKLIKFTKKITKMSAEAFIKKDDETIICEFLGLLTISLPTIESKPKLTMKKKTYNLLNNLIFHNLQG